MSCKNVILKKGEGTVTFRDYQRLIILQNQRKLCLVTSNFSGFPKINQNFQGRNREKQYSPKHSLSVQLTHLLSFPVAPKLRGCLIRAFKLRISFISQQRQFFQRRRKKKKRQHTTMYISNIFSTKYISISYEKGLSSTSILLVQIKKKKNPTVFVLLPTSTS